MAQRQVKKTGFYAEEEEENKATCSDKDGNLGKGEKCVKGKGKGSGKGRGRVSLKTKVVEEEVTNVYALKVRYARDKSVLARDQKSQTDVVDDEHIERPELDETEILKCGICLEGFDGDKIIPMVNVCGHVNCKRCIDRMIALATSTASDSSFTLYPRPNVRSVVCPLCRTSLNPSSFIKLCLSSVRSISGDERLKFKAKLEGVKNDCLVPAAICLSDWGAIEASKLKAVPLVVGQNMLKHSVPRLIANVEAHARVTKSKFVNSCLTSSIVSLQSLLVEVSSPTEQRRLQQQQQQARKRLREGDEREGENRRVRGSIFGSRRVEELRESDSQFQQEGVESGEGRVNEVGREGRGHDS